jgi:hypothetical protein
MTSTTKATVIAWALLGCSIAARSAEAPPPPAPGPNSRAVSAGHDILPPAERDYVARTGVTPSCLAIQDRGDFADLRPLKGLIPMTIAELKYPTWKMLHTHRAPTDEEKTALRAYGLKYTGCAETNIEICKQWITDPLQKVVCGTADYVDLQANEILKVLVSGGTFDSYTAAVTVIAAGSEASAIRALALEKALEAKQK